MKAIFKRELHALLTSLRGWGYVAVVLLTAAVTVLMKNVIGGEVQFELNVRYIALGMIPATVIAAADVFQADRRQNTERLLYSLPLRNWQIVAGKLLALLVPVAIAMLGLCLYPLMLLPFCKIALASAYASVLALAFVGITLMSIGLYVSAYANNLLTAILGIIALPIVSWAAPIAAGYLAAVPSVNLALIIGVMLMVFAAVWLMSGSGMIAVVMTAVIEIPLLISYLRRSGNALMGSVAEMIGSLNLFDTLSPFENGLLDGRVLVGQLAAAAFFTFMTVLLIYSRRQAKRRAL